MFHNRLAPVDVYTYVWSTHHLQNALSPLPLTGLILSPPLLFTRHLPPKTRVDPRYLLLYGS